MVVPADATSIVAAADVAGGSRLAFAYGALASLALASTGSQRLRINTAVGYDLPWSLARLSLPILLLGAITMTLGASAASPAQDLGSMLGGRYRLDRPLGTGGTAAVYQATDLRLNRTVAVKLLHRRLADDPAVLARFWQEAQAAAAISHPGVVAVYDFGAHQGTTYIVLELVTGEPLNQLLARHGPLPPARAVAIAAGICDALAAAHRRGLVHRDIKPGNVMVSPAGDTVKVMDFGLARPAEAANGLTEPGMVAGTAEYISPEQARGQPAEARSDLYAVGVVMYELLCGQRPFSGTTPVGIALQHVSASPRRLDQRHPELPAGLVAVVHQALAKDPADRPPTAMALRRRLERAIAAPIPAPVAAAQAGDLVDEPGAVTAPLPAVPGWAARPAGRQ